MINFWTVQLAYALEQRDGAWSVVESDLLGSHFSRPALDQQPGAAPALEHAIGHLGCWQRRTAGEDRCLMPVRAQPGDLAEVQPPLKETDRLIADKIFHAPSVRNPADAPLAIRQQIKAQGQQLAKRRGAPVSAIT